jgi:carbamoyltransferase
VNSHRESYEYFLSCYLTPPGDISVLTPRHDQNVALWRRSGPSVELIRLWELERISGQKHHYWPLFTVERATQMLEVLLSSEGLSLQDIGAIWGTPGLPNSAEIPVPQGGESYPLHSLAHLYSGLLVDTEIFKNETIFGMAIDGGPDFALDDETKHYWYAGCLSVRGKVSFLPVESPAPLYEASRFLLGGEPGTLMALASACPTEIEFDSAAAIESMHLFGGRTPPLTLAIPFVRSVVETAERQLAGKSLGQEFTPHEHLQAAVMKIVQYACECIAVRNIERIVELSGIDPSQAYLSVSGGFALNCPTNSSLLNRYSFKGMLAPPCVNDSGQAMGMGLLGLLGSGVLESAEFKLDSAYCGHIIDDVDDAIEYFSTWVEGVEEFSEEQFVRDICEAPLVWADGAAEIGPRALGHRSLLGDPRSQRTKDLLNEYKDRQWWRPVAPIVMAEHTGEWFEQSRSSPYMLETSQVHEWKREAVPAILHLDNSARHQTLTSEDNPLLHQAISAFRDETGVPIICNTSLNGKGEPIANTATQALNFAVRKGIRVAYLAGRRVQLRAESIGGDMAPLGPHPRSYELFVDQEEDRDGIWNGWLNRGYNPNGMFLMSSFPELRSGKIMATPADVNQLAEHGFSKDKTFALVADRFVEMYGPGSGFSPDSPVDVF